MYYNKATASTNAATNRGINMNKQFLVSWIEGEDIGTYRAEDADGAILAAVKDAGYPSLERAKDFIYDEKGQATLQALEV
jgi:hypothetical protein